MKKEHVVSILRGRLRERELVPKDILDRTSDDDVVECYIGALYPSREAVDPEEYPKMICEATCVEEFLAMATGKTFP